ncbi:MAG: hypothetical protein KL863_07500 [Rhizobium sp.]|nr:hypothetical protein [Rhizobium sp.]
MSDFIASTEIGYVIDTNQPYVDVRFESDDAVVTGRLEPEAVRRIARRLMDAASEAESFLRTDTGGGTA